jgi:hypothetical protein
MLLRLIFMDDFGSSGLESRELDLLYFDSARQHFPMDELRLGDVIDDYCIKCRRLTNHAIVSMVEGDVAKVRCRSCYHDHNYLREQAPPSKKDLKKAELFNAVLASVEPTAAPSEEPEPATTEASESVSAERKPRGRATTKKA